MKHIDVLETEYKEQYNQYRWIGQMQVAVLTFYGVVTAFAMAAVAAFRPQTPTAIDYRWPAGVMIVLGFLGLFVGYGLFRSRTMQRRTARYLTTLLVQMASDVDDAKSVKNSALRFRSLCSTRDRFMLWDTMNIVILIALYSGEVFLITGILAFLVVGSSLCLNQAVMIGVICMVVLLVVTLVLAQKLVMDKETVRMTTDYKEAEKMQTLQQMQEHLGLPKKVEAEQPKSPPA